MLKLNLLTALNLFQGYKALWMIYYFLVIELGIAIYCLPVFFGSIDRLHEYLFGCIERLT